MRNEYHDSKATQVALVCCGGILGDVIRRSVEVLPDTTLVADFPFDDPELLCASLHKVQPDVVIWLLDDDSVIAEHGELLCADPGWVVIAVTDDGRRGASWELRPHRTNLATPSIDGLVDALRDVSVRR